MHTVSSRAGTHVRPSGSKVCVHLKSPSLWGTSPPKEFQPVIREKPCAQETEAKGKGTGDVRELNS